MRSCMICLVRQILLELSIQKDEVNAEHDRHWGNDKCAQSFRQK